MYEYIFYMIKIEVESFTLKKDQHNSYALNKTNI